MTAQLFSDDVLMKIDQSARTYVQLREARQQQGMKEKIYNQLIKIKKTGVAGVTNTLTTSAMIEQLNSKLKPKQKQTMDSNLHLGILRALKALNTMRNAKI